MTAFHEPDLRIALWLVRDLEDEGSSAGVRRAVLTALPRLIDCATLTWATLDVDRMRVLDVATASGSVRVAAGRDLGPLRRSDIGVRRAFRRTLRSAPDHQLCLSLPHGHGRVTGLALHRGRHDFRDAELALLELLRPHLLHAVRRTDEAERLDGLHLTPRERAVLDLVAGGAANVAIARRLQVRPRTIDKHLEHAYGKLGVSSRTAAVARLREITH